MTTKLLRSTPTASTTDMIRTAFSAFRKNGTERKLSPLLSLGTNNDRYLKLLQRFHVLDDVSCKRMVNQYNYVPII
jgi:hypothetical protein